MLLNTGEDEGWAGERDNKGRYLFIIFYGEAEILRERG